MPRHAAPVRGVLLLAVLVITLGSAVPVLAAGDSDPECVDGGARGGPPAGTDMSTACPVRELRTEVVDLDTEPLLPYVVGLVVMAGVLGMFGAIAMRVAPAHPNRRRSHEEDWWPCPSCGAQNPSDRARCFSCQASRAGPSTHSNQESPTGGTHPA